MALFDRPEIPEFDVELRKLETSDKSHASLFNTMFQKLFINTLFLKKKTETNEAAIDTAYQNGNEYTDQKIAELVNGAPETLNTLKEVADAIEANEDVVTALNAAIGEKVKQTEFDTHEGNNTIHIAASERTKWDEITDVKAQVEENTAAISEQNKNLNEVKTKILARTTLYTGAQVAVNAFDLGIDLSSYDSYEVLCYMSTSGGKTIISSGVIPIGFDAFPCYSTQDRQFTYTVTNSLHAEVGRSNGGTNNTVLSPYKVYGYKTIE